MDAVGVPSPYLFAALLVGLTRALTVDEQLVLPRKVFVAQAVTGVALATYLRRSALHVLADDWLAVTLVRDACPEPRRRRGAGAHNRLGPADSRLRDDRRRRLRDRRDQRRPRRRRP